MKVDYHVHLEEGPYSLRWLNRTAEALRAFCPDSQLKHSLPWLEGLFHRLADRMRRGAYSAEWLDLYRMRAKDLGLQTVGIVDHLYRFREYKRYFEQHMHLADDPLGQLQQCWLDQVCVASIEEFTTFVQSQKPRWETEGIQLKLGIELDYFPGGEQELTGVMDSYPWDHCIGSVHFLAGWGFDNPDTQERFAEEDLLSLYGRHFSVVGQAISSNLFDIVAHLDNLKVFGHRPDETFLKPHYQRIAELLRENDVATEINTGLYYRYPVREMCPSMSFLEVLADHGVAITTSSDAHFPDHLGSHLAEARERLQQAGFHSIAVFDQRRRKEVPLV
ncbi:histidinol phosphate phosphatase domain-containing protein [Brevibacillus sp. H7]|uniref:histidinol phosphate phosphatase domain-containing protein n=1 Tax=Brevibacillus sp. H7 TaxID=3349138 RepID=UPI0037FB8730